MKPEYMGEERAWDITDGSYVQTVSYKPRFVLRLLLQDNTKQWYVDI